MTDTALIEALKQFPDLAEVKRINGLHNTLIEAIQAIEALEQSQLVSQSDLALLLSFAPKDTPEGLFPTFYHTLTYEGDKAITDRLAELRKNLKPITPPTQESET